MALLSRNCLQQHSENGKIRAVNPAQIAAGASLGLRGMRRMVPFAVEFLRKREHSGRTKLDTKTATLAQFGIYDYLASGFLRFLRLRHDKDSSSFR
jgi:hypothetical protein